MSDVYLHASNVVLGAGATGSAAAYHLAARGAPVLLIDQFPLGHDRGSSHGVARIIRHSYSDATYARLMPAAYSCWRRLEAQAGETLTLRTGGVSVCPQDVPYVGLVASNLAELDVPHRRMTGREWNGIHSQFQVPDNHDVVFEPDAGLIKASRALQVQIEQARSLGPDTKVLEGVAVRAIHLDGDRPALVTDRGRIVADRLIVAAGAWTGRLIPGLAERLEPTRQVVFYLRPEDASAYEIGHLPVFIAIGSGPLDAFYGMPSALGCGVKVARHGGPLSDPDDDAIPNAADLATVRRFLSGCLPALAEAPVDRVETCLYTMAPNDHFQVGPLPGRPDVVVASPCSGHGFKFSCLIGSILADLALGGQTGHDLTPWRW